MTSTKSKTPADTIEPAAMGYPAHRERQRRRILEAAERLFDERGIDRVTVAEITTASGLRTSTTYQYFKNKDEIVWALLGELLEENASRVNREMSEASTGFEKIGALLSFFADELEGDTAKVRFMAQFDAMYARDWPVTRLLTLEAQVTPDGFQSFKKLILDGIADGSLRPDLDPELTMHAVVNAAIGAQRRLASLGDKVEFEYGQSICSLFRETVRIILLGLRAEPITSGTTARQKQNRKVTTKRSV
jgi:AcrR family transcriptional regulator